MILPPELEPLRQPYLRILRSWVWVDEQLLKYLRYKKVSILLASPGDLGENPENCRKAAQELHRKGIKSIRETDSWSNCMTRAFTDKLLLNLNEWEEWRTFLKAYGATEKIIAQ